MNDGKSVLEDRMYTQEDDWIQKIGDKKFRIGVTDYAQHELKEIYTIELSKTGQELKQFQKYGFLEAEKNSFELKIPISGKIIAVNEKGNFGDVYDEGETSTTKIFTGDLHNINEKPYETWFVEIEADDESQLEKLLKPEDYKKKINA